MIAPLLGVTYVPRLSVTYVPGSYHAKYTFKPATCFLLSGRHPLPVIVYFKRLTPFEAPWTVAASACR